MLVLKQAGTAKAPACLLFGWDVIAFQCFSAGIKNYICFLKIALK